MSAVSDDAVEAACRAMHEFLGTGEADDLMLGPSDNSWDAPTWPRWKQWREAAEAAISAAYIAACDPQTILALLDEVERLRGLLAEARTQLDYSADTAREHILVARIDEALSAHP